MSNLIVLNFDGIHTAGEVLNKPRSLQKDGTPCAFQLKAKDLSLRNWRDPDQPLKGQIEDLLDLPIQHPSFPQSTTHRSTLVTTGNLDDTLRQTISVFNQGRKTKGQTTLDVWVKGHIETKIRAALGRFMPGPLENFRDFLQLALVDGKGTPDKKRVAAFLKERVSQLQQTSPINQITAACAETLILGIYLVQPYQLSHNHISEIEVWTLMAATLLNVACLSGPAKRVAFQSLGLIELGVWEAMQSLVAELQTREIYTEGDVWTDAYFYRARMTHVAGFLSSAVLWEKWFGEEPKASGVLDRFWQECKGQMCLWGEGAIPSFLAVGWAFDQISARWEMESLVMMVISQICQLNRDGGNLNAKRGDMSGSPSDVVPSGLADPYVSLSDVLLEGIDKGKAHMGATYLGRSFALESLVKILARRRLRQHLASLWSAISDIAFETYVPIEPSSLWNWSNGDEAILSRDTLLSRRAGRLC